MSNVINFPVQPNSPFGTGGNDLDDPTAEFTESLDEILGMAKREIRLAIASQNRGAIRRIEDACHDLLEVLPKGHRDDPWPAEGMLNFYGYRVGTKGLSKFLRREILKHLMDTNALVPINSRHYVRKWGSPNSMKRFSMLETSLIKFSNNASKLGPSYEQAIADWTEDLNFLSAELDPRVG